MEQEKTLEEVYGSDYATYDSSKLSLQGTDGRISRAEALGLKKAVGYIRVSTKQQAGEDRCGREVQKEAIEKYADANGYMIVRWFEDQMSGARDHRPALDAILYGDGDNAIANPPYDAVIAFKSDRISRDTKMYFYYLYTLEKKGVQLISTQENFEDDPYGLSSIYRSLILFVAEQERKNISLRTGKGRYVKAQSGGHASGKAPYGYKIEDKKLIVVPEEAEMVRKVFELRDEGMTMAQIAMRLIDLGYRTRSNTLFQVSTIQRILEKEKLYHGWYKFGNMEEYVSGQHEAILEDERSPYMIYDGEVKKD